MKIAPWFLNCYAFVLGMRLQGVDASFDYRTITIEANPIGVRGLLGPIGSTYRAS